MNIPTTNVKVAGSAAYQFGRYEFLQLWAVLWPLIVGGIVTFLTSEATDLQGSGQVLLASVVSLAATGIKQWLANNSGKRV